MILKIYGLFLRFLQILIAIFYKKTNNHIILGSSAGTNVNGNTKALFLYMINESTPLKGYFITRNRKLYLESIKEYPEHFLYAYSFRALFIFLSAKAYILTHGNYDVFPFKCTNMGKPLINLWHGFPMKKLGLDCHFMTNRMKRKLVGDYDGVVAISETDELIMSRCLRTKPENMWVTGYPRNDFLFNKDKSILNKTPYAKGKKIILYANTFRDFEKTDLFPFSDFNKEELQQFLIKNNAVMLLRIHKNELKRHNLEENEVIKICDGDTIQEVNELLPFVDVLVTDYSSVYIDYLLLNKPIVYLPYDLDKFTKTRGFNFDYHQVTPGPKVDSFANFINSIEDYLVNPVLDSNKRAKVRNLFHRFLDKQSSKRVYDKIIAEIC